MVGEGSGRQVTASSGKVEIASMGQPVESSFNKVVSIFKSISWNLLGVHCKKRLTIFLSPAGMSLTKVSLAGNNSRPGRVWLMAGTGLGRENRQPFLQCMMCFYSSGHGVKGTFLRDEYCFKKSLYNYLTICKCADCMRYCQNVRIQNHVRLSLGLF